MAIAVPGERQVISETHVPVQRQTAKLKSSAMVLRSMVRVRMTGTGQDQRQMADDSQTQAQAQVLAADDAGSMGKGQSQSEADTETGIHGRGHMVSHMDSQA